MQLENIGKEESRIEEELKKWTKDLESAKLMLIEDVNPQKLLEGIRPQVKNYKITETGALQMEISIQKMEGLTIFGDTPAVVDGCFETKIKDDKGKELGHIIFVIPYGGATRYCTINGICTRISPKLNEYHFDFVSRSLWAQDK